MMKKIVVLTKYLVLFNYHFVQNKSKKDDNHNSKVKCFRFFSVSYCFTTSLGANFRIARTVHGAGGFPAN